MLQDNKSEEKMKSYDANCTAWGDIGIHATEMFQNYLLNTLFCTGK